MIKAGMRAQLKGRYCTSCSFLLSHLNIANDQSESLHSTQIDFAQVPGWAVFWELLERHFPPRPNPRERISLVHSASIGL